MIPLLGVTSSEGRVILFFVLTIGLIVAGVLIVRRVRDHELTVLGLVVAAVAIGYSLLTGGVQANASVAGASVEGGVLVATSTAAATLMKIAVILVLAGVFRSLLLAWPGAPVSEAPKP
jgi:hypothetical protein